MSAPTTVEEFLELGQKSGLLDRDGLGSYLEQKRSSDSLPAAPKTLAQLMVRDGLLTEFQARQLLAGKWRGFLIDGKYRLLECLGAGGMGTVYLCEHVIMRRRVAVKVLPPNRAADPAFVERFHREARAAAALDHPNIVRAHDVGSDGKIHFLVMEYVEGRSLHRVVAEEGPLAVARACDCICQAAQGLQHAHEAGLVHRDVNPSNLLLDRTGTVKVLDMGLARFFQEDDDGLTRDHAGNSVLGTANFVAPEQVMDSHSVDGRADVYSLGVTLYFLLTGGNPFAGGSVAQKLIGHLVREPRPVRELRPEVPEGLAEVLRKMMAKDPQKRYQTPAQVIAALAPWKSPAAQPSQAPAAEGPRNPDHTPIPRPAAARPPQPAPSEAVTRTPVPTRRTHALPTALPAAAGPVPSPRPGDVPWALVGTAAGGALVLLGVIALVIFLVTYRGRPAPRPAPANSAAADSSSPDRPADFPTPFVGHTDRIEGVAFSADGKFALSTGHDRTVRLWEVPGGRLLRTLHGHQGPGWSVAFLPDGRRALSSGSDRTLRLWDLEAGLELRRFEGHADEVKALALSRDGRRALSGSEDGTIRLWDVDTGKELKRLEGHVKGVWCVAISPDGHRALSAGSDKTMRLWDLDWGKELHAFQGHAGEVRRVAFSPDGRRALSGGFDMTLRLWDVESGKELLCCDGSPCYVESVSFSPGGRYALTSEGMVPSNDPAALRDRGIRLWDLKTGRQIFRRGGVADKVLHTVFSPDGRRALSACDDKIVRLWELPPLAEDVAP